MIETKFKKINLQLFASPNTNVTSDAGLSVENKTHYDMTLIDEASPQLVHDQFGQKRPIPKNGGKKIEFRKFASLPKALTPLTEGVTPDGKKLSASAIEAEVAQYGDYVVLSDVLDLTSIDPVVVEATKVIGRQAGLTLDTITRNILNSGTNVFYAPKAGGAAVDSRAALDNTCLLTVDMVKRVVAFLKRNNAPKIDGSYVAIIHPDSAYDLMNDKEWQYPHQYKDTENIYEGEIGKIAGVRFVETSEANIFHAEDLLPGKRTLSVPADAEAMHLIKVDVTDGTLEKNQLAGRWIILNGERAYVGSNTEDTLVVYTDSTKSMPKAMQLTKDAVIYPGEAGAEGADVYSTLFIADGAYGVTEITGGGIETIIKQLGSAGVADPLNQRSSVGWKATKTAEILVETYLVRAEHVATLAEN